MKQNINLKFAAVALVGLMISCSTSNEVASNRGIQKRKYTKGYFFDFNKKLGGIKNADQIAQEDGGEETLGNEETVAVTEVPEKMLTEASNIEKKAEKAEIFTTPIDENVMSTNITVADKIEMNNSEKLDVETTIKDELKNIKSERKFNKNNIIHKKTTMQSSEVSDDAILYYILAILIPFLAVGLVTDWDVLKVVICLLLCFLFWLPGMIYALIVVSQNV